MKTLYSLCIVLISVSAFGQIPNANFENWNTTNYIFPVNWNFFGTITRVSGANGNYAVKMERSGDAPGAVVKGDPQGGQFAGGMPINVLPDSIVGNFNYSIAPNDTAWVLVNFKFQGTTLSFDIGTLTGNSGGGFVHLGFKNHFSSAQLPDTVFVGVTSTNPNDTTNPMGGYVIVDDLEFKDASGTTYPIDNGDFENWNNISNDDPIDWFTSNISYAPYMLFPVSKTTDAQNGNFAIRLENLSFSNGLATAYALCGPQGQNGPAPGFAVSGRDSVFEGYYKFFPQNGDTGQIGIMYFYQGSQVGWGFSIITDTAANYTHFSAPIGFNPGFLGTPDSAAVFMLPFVGGSNPHGNSVLFVDNLSLIAPTVSLHKLEDVNNMVSLFPNPAKEMVTVQCNLKQVSDITISIIDAAGNELAAITQKGTVNTVNMIPIDLTNFENGVYLIKVKTGTSLEIKKLIIQK